MAKYGPSFTRELKMGDLELPPHATYISSADTPPERALGGQLWTTRQRANGVEVVEITHETAESVSFAQGARRITIALHDQAELTGWLVGLPSPIYIDFTALALRTWAPLLRALLGARIRCRFVYVEPLGYTPSDELGQFSLSDYTEGIGAIPGFAPVADTTNEAPPLIPMLGFEGSRLGRVLDKLEPPIEKTRPVVGVPGYRVEFPFHAFEGNRRHLLENHLYSRVSYARANCPFDAFALLDDIHRFLNRQLIQIAPIGTKPHALGATLFAIAHDPNVQLVYDHPKPSARPTHGASRTCVYYLTEFVESELYKAGAA